MKRRLKYFAIILGSVFLLYVVAVVFCTEMYCPWNPSIDTVYADGFSEEAFLTIREGMTMSDVNALMCDPVSNWTDPVGRTFVWYTSDGRCKFWDFAYIQRGLLLTNGVVSEVLAGIAHD